LTQAADPSRLDGDVIATMLGVMSQLVESNRALVELVASLQGDVLDLVEARDRWPAEVREEAAALRGEAEQAVQHAHRLIAEAEAIARRSDAA
jgi:hypothetical protein